MSSLLTIENNEKMPAASSSVLMPVLIEKCILLMQLTVKTVIHSFSLQKLTVHGPGWLYFGSGCRPVFWSDLGVQMLFYHPAIIAIVPFCKSMRERMLKLIP